MRDLKRYGDDFVLVLGVVLVGIAVFYLLAPILVAVAMSFDARRFLGRFPPPGLSLQWYESFSSNSYYLNGLKTSLLLSTATAILSTTIGVSAALYLDRAPPRRGALLATLFVSPLIVPAVVIGFALLLFYSLLGLDNTFLRLLGAHVIVTVPYTIRTTLAGMTGIRRTLVEAALSLGATDARALWDVTLPLARTGILAGMVFAFAFSLDDVAVSLFLSGPETYTLPVALISMMRANFDLTIAAAAVLLVVFTIVLIWLLDRLVGLDTIIGQGVYRG